MQRILLSICAFLFFVNLSVYGQSQSLGDVAREYREKRDAEQAAGVQPKTYTNQDLPPAPPGSAEPAQALPEPRDPAMNRSFDDRSDQRRFAQQHAAAEWRNRIQAQENMVADLQARIDQLNAMIHPGTAQYDAPFTRSQTLGMQRLQQMQRRLDWEKQRLEQMQDGARHAGMPSTAYDP